MSKPRRFAPWRDRRGTPGHRFSPGDGDVWRRGICGVVVFYVPDDPAGVSLLGAVAVAFSLAGGPDAIEERGGGAHDGNK